MRATLALLLFVLGECPSTSLAVHTVTLTVWTTPNVDWNHENIIWKNTKEIVARLMQEEHVLIFEPKMYIHGGGGGGVDQNNDCIHHGRYCTAPLREHVHPLAGSILVVESARRQCIWQLSMAKGNPMLFWEYLEVLQATQCDVELTGHCLETVFAQIGLDDPQVQECMWNGTSPEADVENPLLQRQLDLAERIPVANIPQVLVNGRSLQLDITNWTTASIFQSVCQAYPNGSAPSLCSLCLAGCPSSIDHCLYIGARSPSSVPSVSSLRNFRELEQEISKDERDNFTIPGLDPLANLLAKRDILVYQMLNNCGWNVLEHGPFVDALDAGNRDAYVTGLCDSDGAHQFFKACTAFERCAGFDFLEFAENNADAVGKSFFGCLDAFAAMPSKATIAIQECTALLLQTGLSRPLGYFLEYNTMICPCISDLQSGLPDCVFQREETKSALDGKAVSLATCMLGQLCNSLDHLCQGEVLLLNECLPSIGEGEDPPSCQQMEESCKSRGALLFTAPSPLSGVAFPGRCQSIARQGKKLHIANVIKRYNSYRSQCILNKTRIHDFGSHDAPEGTATQEAEMSFSPAAESEEAIALSDHGHVWRFLALGVGFVATGFSVSLLWAHKRGHQRYRHGPPATPQRMEAVDELCNTMEKRYRDEVEVKEESGPETHHSWENASTVYRDDFEEREDDNEQHLFQHPRSELEVVMLLGPK